MKKLFLLISALSFILCSVSVARSQVIYEVSFPNPNTHYINVKIHFSGLPTDSFDVKMPVWIPGSYMIREFSRNVESFNAATADNRPLQFKKVRKNAWRVYNDTNNTVTISYDVYAFELSIRTSFVDIDQAYINGTSVFMYTPELMNQAALINFHPYKGWNYISTGLMQFSTNPWSRVAENYDQLADCPVVIGNQDIFTFNYKGIPHHIAMVGKANYNKDKIIDDFTKIVDHCTSFFGDNPNKDYTFIIHNAASRGGGLEHANSTSVMINRNDYENEKSYKSFLSTIAHEYFHIWAVKRIRPIELGPFDYDNEVYTNQLWFFEGLTSYYDDYILYKTGIYSEADYLEIVQKNLSTIINTPGDRYQSLAESSFDAWIKFYRQNENSKNSTVSYYTKGGVLGAVLDLEIISSTEGAKSLRDVFSHLYNEHYKKHGRGITDIELQEAFEVVTGKSYDDFFKKYIYGTTPIPYEQYFQLAGIQIVRNDGKRKPTGYLGVTFSHSGSRLVISYVERGSAAWNQGLNTNDEILSVDGKEPMQVRDYLAGKQPGESLQFTIIRGGIMREFTIILGEPTTVEPEFEFIKKPTPSQKLVKSIWLSSK